MKNKDYVSSKKRNTRAKQDAPAKRPFPFIRFLVVGLLIAGFAYGLFYIQQDSDSFNEAQTKPISKPKKKAEKVIPPPPTDEEWEFIDELENKNVEVETEELADRGPYKMQCASFRNKADAERMKAQIAFAGFESQVVESQGTTGLWHKVILGPFERKRDAEKTRHILRRNDIRGCQIWGWR